MENNLGPAGAEPCHASLNPTITKSPPPTYHPYKLSPIYKSALSCTVNLRRIALKYMGNPRRGRCIIGRGWFRGQYKGH